LKKCAFAQSQIEYLGHIISSNGVAIDPSKTAAMVNWHIPTSLTEVRGFLGLTGYYRKFVKNYGVLAKPLTQLLKHKIFSWPLEADTTFQTLKHAMCCVPVLALLDFEVPFEIETDACEMGVGAMLSQNSHPIAFFSKALSIRNQQLPTYERVFCCPNVCRQVEAQFVEQPFIIMTNHKSLCHLQDQKLSTDMQRKAMSKLVGLQFKLQYKRGIENSTADALSNVGQHFLGNCCLCCHPCLDPRSVEFLCC
jgi:hypothetical protein